MKSKAELFRADPRIAQAKLLILEALQDHTSKIRGISSPEDAYLSSSSGMIQEYSEIRGAPLFYPFLGTGIGHGSLVELIDGSVKYDMITGIGVHYFGHSHPQIVEAAIEGALRDTIMQGNLQQNEESLALGKKLVSLSGLPHCFFCTSGVMANENALKLAFQKHYPADRILAFDHCFAGRSLTFSQVTDKPAFRGGLPLNQPVDYIPFYDHERGESSIQASILALKKLIERYPQKHAVMMFELIQGEAGFYTAPREFFEPLMRICKEAHIAVFADEVQTFARTKQLFAYQMLNLEKYVDITAIGKLSQVCAILFTEEYKPKPGLLSQTFTGSTASILSCLKLLELIESSNLYGDRGRIAEIELKFHTHLERLSLKHPKLLRGPFGRGAMIAFTPFDGTHDQAVRTAQALFDAGVLSFIAGTNPTRIRFLVPALVITDPEIDHVMEIVEETLLKAAQDAAR